MPFIIVKEHDGTILGAATPRVQTTTDHPGWLAFRPSEARSVSLQTFGMVISFLRGHWDAYSPILTSVQHEPVTHDEMEAAQDRNHVLTLAEGS